MQSSRSVRAPRRRRPAPASPPRTPREAACAPGPLDRCVDHRLFAALGEPTRARIFTCIAKCSRPCAVGEIAECCAVDLSVVSRHLKSLARAGALGSMREGRTVRYAVRAPELASRFRDLAALLDRPGPNPSECVHGCC